MESSRTRQIGQAMDELLISITGAAKYVGVSRRRILQMVETGRLRSVRENGHHFIRREDAEILKREQTFLRSGQACERLGVTYRELILLIHKDIVKPRNIFSRHLLFNPTEIDACVELVKSSFSVEDTAAQLGLSRRHVYHLIAEEELRSVETIHGRRVPKGEVIIYLAIQWLGGA